MSSKTTVALSALVAVIVAGGLIAAALFVPGLGANEASQTTLSSPSTVASSSASSSSHSTVQNGQGALAILLTDPPTVPENVSAVYMQYNMVQVHIADAGNETGWYSLNGSGVVNLMGVVNVSQTIANASLPAGKFNGMRFNATQVTVVYNNVSYNATMINGEHTLYTWIPGGINVTAAETSAAIIDLTPTILMAGTPTNLTFIFVPASVGYVIPTASIPAESHTIGGLFNLTKSPWWNSIQSLTKFGITNVVLTPDSLKITVVNQGTASVVLRLAGVTTTSSMSGGIQGLLKTSDIFTIESDGSLVNMNVTTAKNLIDQVAAGGLLLASGQSVILTYSGTIEIGLQTSILHLHSYPISTIVSGTKYEVWVTGNGQVVQAGASAG